jgi:nucleotide-binding universal stress UspA family protein
VKIQKSHHCQTNSIYKEKEESSILVHALVAIDGSPQSEHALTQFLRMIKPDETKVTVLYVIAPSRYVVIPEIPGYSGTQPQPLSEISERLIKQEEEMIANRAQMISTDEDVPIEITIRMGDPRNEILAAAEDLNVSLIVMGSTGKGLGERLLLGSVSTYVTTHSRFSTLMIR